MDARWEFVYLAVALEFLASPQTCEVTERHVDLRECHAP